MLVYTSITKNYLPKARVLARSLKLHNPGWQLHVILCDTLPENFDPLIEPFDSVWTLDRLGIPNWKSWAFGHTLVELCTAVKGTAAKTLADAFGTDRIMYLDPDIKIFASLKPLDELLDQYDILVTPHLLDPEEEAGAIIDNEICSLLHGVYNLGFFAARCSGQGRAFLDWWSRRLQQYCIADFSQGLFTDQRWIDLAPGLFDRLHIVRDRGYNVATWNIHHRRISRRADGAICAGDRPLRFYHFTGYDSGDGRGVLLKYAADQYEALELWDAYAFDLIENGHRDPALNCFAYGDFSNGVPIDARLRRIYRERKDLQEAFPDPFEVKKWSLYSWWEEESKR